MKTSMELVLGKLDNYKAKSSDSQKWLGFVVDKGIQTQIRPLK